MYNQVNQEQIAAGVTTENIAEIFVVQEHVTAHEIPEASQVVDSLLPVEEFTGPVYNHVNHEQIFPACSGTPVFEYAPPAHLTEYIAPAPAVTPDAHSQQLPLVYIMTTVTTDDNLDITGLMYPQFSSTAVEPFSPHVVGPLPPLEEFTEPVIKSIRNSSLQER